MLERPKNNRFIAARWRMLEKHLRGRDITDPRVLDAMARIPREDFVPAAYVSQAYSDGPLPIGSNQTISQPYIVALMTQELQVTPDCEVLEIGTGSGYQTAILSRLARTVCTIERYPELSESAGAVLARLGVRNVEFRVGDGSCGWPAPRTFDRIMVTAAVPAIPQPLMEQLAPAGIIIAPVGGTSVQRLVARAKSTEDVFEKFICDVRFVKLLGRHGFREEQA